ncbi:serine/threonine protein phosphatase [Stutzerimonas kirkiae]|uniref:Serine/threonine protein phosphatase n=1 Tax=Stutzerimonas kirkiae TaxID=2211392 RepID=A0A4V2KCZ2_9GAMM|nr:metallophosphoesterase [Stutzerimonas kirkiae]TBU96860.1 serine/threonine protein phosphatase [Stutzerimonas kirkiae]TBV00542.1 serine/threonine protein phosphatase [Stutzerimonas kirkiae]TBV16723.1 serine/threonine protein phosphatase [Stutzerimonas kirkiae]
MLIDPERSYDLIGDVHGCADELERLLDLLGYRKHGAVWRHPWRQVIFLGDIIDRGPRIRESLHLVQGMVATGEALCIMGNHEFNALGWYAPAPPGSGKTHVREHSSRYATLLRETFQQFEHYPEDWKAFRAWFYEMPLYLESERFRVVHACWDNRVITRLRPHLDEGRIDPQLLGQAAFDDGFVGKALDRLLRGTDMPLPEGLTLTSEEGFTRSFFRTKFWEENPHTYGDVVFQPDALPEHAARMPLTQSQKSRLFLYGPEEPLLFIGHYWRRGRPGPLRENLACLDYSAVKGGKLVAYRLDRERHLDAGKFVWVDVAR